VLPGQQNIGLLATVLLGWIGSLVGGFVGDHVVNTGRFATVLLEIAAAAALIAAYSASQNRVLSGRPGRRSLRW
jgi:uncharacterized membrane protein YeaQ/YmgE (transglycosylase-associated protein family)